MSARAVLVGPMGAGKSTVAGLLGARWGMPVRDTDTDIEQSAGKEIAEIFVEDGEAYFRALEREAVRLALAEHDGVLALGGGAVLDPATQELLQGQCVVFLSVGLSDAVRRVGLGAGRPMLLGNVRSQMKTLLDQRAPVYRSVAQVVVDTDGRPAEEVADEVAAAVERLEGSSR